MGFGAWKGWTFQAYYMSMFLVLYLVAQRINEGVFMVVLFPELSLDTKKILHLEVASALVFALFFLIKRLHSYIFKQVESVPGHRLIGTIFGLITGALVVLFLSSIINLTDFKTEKWWIESTENQISVLSFELIHQAIK
jgi:uncharacterized membrane protein required for colicin V production